MENHNIRLKRIIECTDPTRKSSWHIRMFPPIDQEQFEIVERVIRSLRTILDSYLVVELGEPLQEMSFLQMCRDNEDLWRIELQLEQPNIFSYKRNGKTYIRKHPWTQMVLKVDRVDEAIRIFREVLCDHRMPDLSYWKDGTRQIYMERFSRK